jgi:hypothetical protein
MHVHWLETLTRLEETGGLIASRTDDERLAGELTLGAGSGSAGKRPDEQLTGKLFATLGIAGNGCAVIRPDERLAGELFVSLGAAGSGCAGMRPDERLAGELFVTLGIARGCVGSRPDCRGACAGVALK